MSWPMSKRKPSSVAFFPVDADPVSNTTFVLSSTLNTTVLDMAERSITLLLKGHTTRIRMDNLSALRFKAKTLLENDGFAPDYLWVVAYIPQVFVIPRGDSRASRCPTWVIVRLEIQPDGFGTLDAVTVVPFIAEESTELVKALNGGNPIHFSIQYNQEGIYELVKTNGGNIPVPSRVLDTIKQSQEKRAGKTLVSPIDEIPITHPDGVLVTLNGHK